MSCFQEDTCAPRDKKRVDNFIRQFHSVGFIIISIVASTLKKLRCTFVAKKEEIALCKVSEGWKHGKGGDDISTPQFVKT